MHPYFDMVFRCKIFPHLTNYAGEYTRYEGTLTFSSFIVYLIPILTSCDGFCLAPLNAVFLLTAHHLISTYTCSRGSCGDDHIILSGSPALHLRLSVSSSP